MSWGATFHISPAVVGHDEEFEKVANSLVPGDELILSDGIYSQGGRRAVTVKGSAEAPIVIRAADGAGPVVTRPAGDMDRHNNIEFVDCSYLVVRGIGFEGGSCGVRFIRGHHVTFENCEIGQTGNNALTMNSGHCDSFVIRGNHIHHTGLSTSGPTEGEGMYIGAHDGRYITTNTLVEGNYIHHLRSTSDGGNDGIEFKFGSWGNTIRDNVIHDTNIGRQYPGIFVYGGGKGVNVVEGNVIWRAGEGIQVVSDAIIRNNVILDCSVAGITAAPHGAVPKMRNVKIVHNTIVNHPRGIRIRWSKAENMVFANNAVYCPGGMAIDAAGIEDATLSGNCVVGRLGGARIDGGGFIDGGSLAEAFHLSDCNHVVLANLVVRGFASNGINIDDGGTFETPSTYITLEDVSIFETGPTGNHDALKMSGVDRFVVRRCRFEGWGGSGIDMVGCHEGVVTECVFVGRKGFSQSNGVQMKGGSRGVLVERCLFRDAGQRSINCGGSTGLAYFRPKVGDFEAKDITIAGNRFVGSTAPVAWVTSDGGYVHHNTIVFPDKWVLRILQETRDERFGACHGGLFEENVIVYDSRVSVFVNVGTGTAPGTFTFGRNAWCAVGDGRKPVLPTAEADGIYGVAVARVRINRLTGEVHINDPRVRRMGAGGYKH